MAAVVGELPDDGVVEQAHRVHVPGVRAGGLLHHPHVDRVGVVVGAARQVGVAIGVVAVDVAPGHRAGVQREVGPLGEPAEALDD